MIVSRLVQISILKAFLTFDELGSSVNPLSGNTSGAYKTWYLFVIETKTGSDVKVTQLFVW